MSLSNLTNVSISGRAQIQNVEGDQCNDYRTTIEAQTVHVHGKAVLKEIRDEKDNNDDGEYNQFHQLIRGDLCNIKEIYRDSALIAELQNDGRGWLKRPEIRRTVQLHTSKVRGEKGRFTVISYHGKDAQKAWRQDFRDYSQNQNPYRFQIFGINRSQVPALIFYDEMIPFANVFKEESPLMNLCTIILREQLGCSFRRLWVDSKKGRVCSGPEGPYFKAPPRYSATVSAIPLTLEMFKEDIFARFLGQEGDSDMDIVMLYLTDILCWESHFSIVNLNELHVELHSSCGHGVHSFSPDLLRSLRFDTVYSASLEPIARLRGEVRTTWDLRGSTFDHCTNIGHKMTRLRLDRTIRKLYRGDCFRSELTDDLEVDSGWLAQCHNVFAAQDILDGSERCCFILSYFLTICVTPAKLNVLNPSPAVPPFVYLFFPALPPRSADLSTLQSWSLTFGQNYYWSLDRDGTSRLPEDACASMDLPQLTPKPIQVRLDLWPKKAYNTVYKYQIARGFDPTTTQFAESLKRIWPLWEPVTADLDQRKCTEGESRRFCYHNQLIRSLKWKPRVYGGE
ncbi:hypothetical protein WG66_011803 [Moniliophthora roreri]|nr:hypothetical protein WG66_011803 [Moniliophthora roreri]